MKKTIICNIPMKKEVRKMQYKSYDKDLPESNQGYRYVMNSLLSQMANNKDEYKVILLTKRSKDSHTKMNMKDFKEEFLEVCSKTGASAEFVCIDSAFSENRETYTYVFQQLVEEIVIGSHILVDTTFGPKDLPIIIFNVLHFAEKFLKCEIDNILYGHVIFENGEPTNPVITDLKALYYLDSLTGMINCDNPEKAKQMLNSLLSL